MVPSTSIEPVDGVESHRDGSRQHPIFEDQVVQPVPRKRRVGAFHDGLSLAPSALVIVVLASHSPARNTVLRLFAVKPRFSKKSRAVSLASTVSSLVPRPAAIFSSASQSMLPAPCPAAAGCTYTISMRALSASDAKPTADPPWVATSVNSLASFAPNAS